MAERDALEQGQERTPAEYAAIRSLIEDAMENVHRRDGHTLNIYDCDRCDTWLEETENLVRRFARIPPSGSSGTATEPDKYATLETSGEANGCYPCDTCNGFRAHGQPCAVCKYAVDSFRAPSAREAQEPERWARISDKVERPRVVVEDDSPQVAREPGDLKTCDEVFERDGKKAECDEEKGHCGAHRGWLWIPGGRLVWPDQPEQYPATHRCKICGALWALVPASPGHRPPVSDKWWSLRSATCGPCCDNVPMAEQIEPLPPASPSPAGREPQPDPQDTTYCADKANCCGAGKGEVCKKMASEAAPPPVPLDRLCWVPHCTREADPDSIYCRGPHPAPPATPGAEAEEPELWLAINHYVLGCGGDPTRPRVHGDEIRQQAIADITKALTRIRALAASPSPAEGPK